MSENLAALQASAARLREIVEGLTAEQLRSPAYPSEWTIADVLSHLGSGGMIMGQRLDATLTGEDLPDDFAEPIWDTWNAKSPEAKVADGLGADRVFLAQLEALSGPLRDSLRVPFGPVVLDFEAAVGMRLNEHALHTWDVEVVLDPAATIPPDSAEFVVDNLAMIVGFVGKPTGDVHDVHIRTADPVRDFTLALGAESVALTDGPTSDTPDLELPAEAFIRLVYGRLDPDHSPAVHGPADLAELRRAFPGI